MGDRAHPTFEDNRVACPSCAKPNDAVTAVDGQRQPQDGDLVICAYCVTPAVVQGAGLRSLTDLELRAVTDDPVYRQAVAAVIKLNGEQ